MTRRLKPWHDTELHACPDGTSGLVIPAWTGPPHITGAHRHVKCAMCGEDWIEEDTAKLARIWWSCGAWDGIQEMQND